MDKCCNYVIIQKRAAPSYSVTAACHRQTLKHLRSVKGEQVPVPRQGFWLDDPKQLSACWSWGSVGVRHTSLFCFPCVSFMDSQTQDSLNTQCWVSRLDFQGPGEGHGYKGGIPTGKLKHIRYDPLSSNAHSLTVV